MSPAGCLHEDDCACGPKRVQLRRTMGWRKPANTVVVGRPSKWGNPFKVTFTRSAAVCIEAFERHFMAGSLSVTPEMARAELRGANLACFCKLTNPCHADVLLREANR